ncbi:hypothetical protein OEZ86_010639 [Tetradesmus obliquus]|nr:hypothetical protein OEZ86_010639 [Tetradesmus obliquus]
MSSKSPAALLATHMLRLLQAQFVHRHARTMQWLNTPAAKHPARARLMVLLQRSGKQRPGFLALAGEPTVATAAARRRHIC